MLRSWPLEEMKGSLWIKIFKMALQDGFEFIESNLDFLGLTKSSELLKEMGITEMGSPDRGAATWLWRGHKMGTEGRLSSGCVCLKHEQLVSDNIQNSEEDPEPW